MIGHILGRLVTFDKPSAGCEVVIRPIGHCAQPIQRAENFSTCHCRLCAVTDNHLNKYYDRKRNLGGPRSLQVSISAWAQSYAGRRTHCVRRWCCGRERWTLGCESRRTLHSIRRILNVRHHDRPSGSVDNSYWGLAQRCLYACHFTYQSLRVCYTR